MHKKFYKYLHSELSKLKNPRREDMFFAEDYVGGGTSKLTFWNIKVPKIRAVLDQPIPLLALPLEEQFNVFEKIWFDSKIFEIKLIALHWLEDLSDKDLVKFAPRIAKWAIVIDNWAHSDALSGVLARIFDRSPQKLLATYKKWNRHKNPWLRRCSIVGLFYYSRSRKNFPSYQYASKMIARHFGAPEYYVQKAVGWSIREMYNVYPKQTLQFIEKNLHRIKADAWYASSEKLPKQIKDKFVLKRRAQRKLV